MRLVSLEEVDCDGSGDQLEASEDVGRGDEDNGVHFVSSVTFLWSALEICGHTSNDHESNLTINILGRIQRQVYKGFACWNDVIPKTLNISTWTPFSKT